jgi:exocyst complex component 2
LFFYLSNSFEKKYFFFLIEISRIAHSMYDTDLARKDYSDTIRSALNVIQRYRFIFHLPQTIERSVKRVYSIYQNKNKNNHDVFFLI